MNDVALSVRDLTIRFGAEGDAVVSDVSFDLHRGEILGVVGESGAGKSTVGRALLGLVDQPGEIVGGTGTIGETPLFRTDPASLRALRGRRISLILQEPLSALNPVLSVGDQIAEAVAMATGAGRRQARRRAVDLLQQVGIPNAGARMRDYPHQFSGGMRQRVLIAIALAGEPEVIVADEPTTALDVSIQAEILALLRNLCRDRRVAVMLITHDMAVVSQVTDRIMIMRHGRVIEAGMTADVLASPQAAYTRALLAAVPPANRTLSRFKGVAESGGVAAERSNEGTQPHGVALTVSHLTVEFGQRRRLFGADRAPFRAVSDVTFEVPAGGTFGIVGESGSGKSTVLSALLGLVPRASGDIRLEDFAIPRVPTLADHRRISASVQLIFQDPFSSLNPRMRVRDIVAEPLYATGRSSRKDALDQAAALLSSVGLRGSVQDKLPHQFSGGQRQRIAIARALIMEPQVLLCDEPTSALDVSIQAEILNLIKDLRATRGLTLVFVSHDLAVVRQMCDRIGVMEKSQMVEIGGTEEVFDLPCHPYTQRLLSLMPRFEAPNPSCG
ncbi:MAG: ABC transporter ATP-binding protein [Pseudomonadota bacterium]